MTRYYVADTQGCLRFTDTGKKILRPIFANHGIDIRLIKTRRDYVLARLRVRPHFLYEKWLNAPSPIESTPKSLEQQLLSEAIFGDHSLEDFQRLISRRLRRASFRVIEGS